jgi:hypothetical protein
LCACRSFLLRFVLLRLRCGVATQPVPQYVRPCSLPIPQSRVQTDDRGPCPELPRLDLPKVRLTHPRGGCSLEDRVQRPSQFDAVGFSPVLAIHALSGKASPAFPCGLRPLRTFPFLFPHCRLFRSPFSRPCRRKTFASHRGAHSLRLRRWSLERVRHAANPYRCSSLSRRTLPSRHHQWKQSTLPAQPRPCSLDGPVRRRTRHSLVGYPDREGIGGYALQRSPSLGRLPATFHRARFARDRCGPHATCGECLSRAAPLGLSSSRRLLGSELGDSGNSTCKVLGSAP